MDAPDPEGVSILTKAVIAATPLVAAAWGFVKLWDKKADKHAVNNAVNEVKLELGVQRGHIGQIFQQMRDMEKVSEERHRELLMHLVERKGS